MKSVMLKCVGGPEAHHSNIEEHGHEYYADAVHAAIIDGIKQEFSIL